MTVCPALLPPWLRTTMSALAVSTSMILPFPSSPHCAPIKIVFAIEIGNGQKIFPMHPLGHTRDCCPIICFQCLPSKNFRKRGPRPPPDPCPPPLLFTTSHHPPELTAACSPL